MPILDKQLLDLGVLLGFDFARGAAFVVLDATIVAGIAAVSTAIASGMAITTFDTQSGRDAGLRSI